jgi:hypothetical protein
MGFSIRHPPSSNPTTTRTGERREELGHQASWWGVTVATML